MSSSEVTGKEALGVGNRLYDTEAHYENTIKTDLSRKFQSW